MNAVLLLRAMDSGYSVSVIQCQCPVNCQLNIVKRRKLQRYGHVSRSSGLAKTISEGTVKGGRRQGRQRKRWEDNIREWTGLKFGKSQRAVENREKWRKPVAKLSVVPQRPSRLRNCLMDGWIYLCIYVCIYVSIYVCMHVCMYVCKYVCMYVPIYL